MLLPLAQGYAVTQVYVRDVMFHGFPVMPYSDPLHLHQTFSADFPLRKREPSAAMGNVEGSYGLSIIVLVQRAFNQIGESISTKAEM